MVSPNIYVNFEMEQNKYYKTEQVLQNVFKCFGKYIKHSKHMFITHFCSVSKHYKTLRLTLSK